MINRHPLQTEFRYLATIAEIAAIAGAATSIAGTAYSATQSPTQPNGASSSRRVAMAQAAALPYQRGLSAAEQQGGQALRFGYTQSTASQQDKDQLGKQIASLQSQIGRLQNPSLPGAQSRQSNPPGPNETQIQSQVAALQNKIGGLQQRFNAIPDGGGTVYLNKQGKVVDQTEALANFSGYGTADIEGQEAKQYAQLQQDLESKYGTQFATEAHNEAELADPLGTQARAKELDLINQGINNPPPINPMATTLDQRMQDRLKAGSGLDSMSQEALDAAITNANADRGGNVSSGDVTQSLSTGVGGAARRQAGIQQALSYTASGVSPGDVEYRRQQQDLQNLGAFTAGRTPESEFSNLSGAGGAGAAPFYGGQSLPSLPANAGAGGPQYALNNYLTGIRQSQTQANGWTSGISTLLSGIGTANNIWGGGGGSSFTSVPGGLGQYIGPGPGQPGSEF